MKKILNSLLLICLTAVFCSFFAACKDKVTGSGSYFPDQDEMRANLANAGYEYTTISNIMLIDGYCITELSAEKNGDYIDFYWLYTPEQCDTYYNELSEKYPEYDVLIKIENDEKYGCIVFCGTTSAIDAAGIRIVDVNVDVSVKI